MPDLRDTEINADLECEMDGHSVRIHSNGDGNVICLLPDANALFGLRRVLRGRISLRTLGQSLSQVGHTRSDRKPPRKHPRFAQDEQPVQLIKDVKAPIQETLTHRRRVDYEYERAEVANIFMFCEPLAGLREAFTRNKNEDGLAFIGAVLLEGRYADCEAVTLVCDNLITHTRGAFYEVFEPSRARALVKRINWCYTPKHDS